MPIALVTWQVPVLAGVWPDLKNQFSPEHMAQHSWQLGVLAELQSMAGLVGLFGQHPQE